MRIEKIKTFVNSHKLVFGALGIAVLLFYPFLVRQSSYLVSIGVKILLYIMLASSLNVINGYSGQLNIGQAAFYAVGSYVAGLLSTKCGVNFWFLLIISGLVTAFFGFLVSLPTRKLAGTYLALVTLGLSEITRLVILNWNAVTNGPLGVKGVPRASFFGHVIKRSTDFYYLGLVLTGITVFVITRVIRSNVGRSWISIREDVTASKFLGVNVNRMKSLNFAFGAFFAGVAGCYSTFYYQFISPDMFKLDEGFSILAMVIIGGQGTITGPIVGATVVNVLTEVMRFASEYRLVVYGLLIIVMMWIRPSGICGDSDSFHSEKLLGKWKKKKAAAPKIEEVTK